MRKFPIRKVVFSTIGSLASILTILSFLGIGIKAIKTSIIYILADPVWRDIVLSILILSALVCLFLTNKKMKKPTDARIQSELKAEISKIKKELEDIHEEAKKKNLIKEPQKYETSDEDIFILNLLANEEDRALEQRKVLAFYKQRFKEKEQADFQIVVNELDKRDIIEEIESGSGYGELCLQITSQGLSLLKDYRQKTADKK